MLMELVEEHQDGMQALRKALKGAMTAGMLLETTRRLTQVVLGSRKDTLRHALTGEPAADEKPLVTTF